MDTPSTIDPADYQSVPQAALERGISPLTVRYMALKGEVRTCEISGRVFVHRADVGRVLAERKAARAQPNKAAQTA